MTREEVEATARATITEHRSRFSRPPLDIRGETCLVTELQLDSLDLIEVTMDLEERLDIEIDDEAIAQVGTLNELIDFLAAAVEAEGAAA